MGIDLATWRARIGLNCHWSGTTSQVRGIVGSGGTLLLKVFVVVIPRLLIMAGDVELNPGPP